MMKKCVNIGSNMDIGLMSPEDQERLLQEIEQAFNELIKETELELGPKASDMWDMESEYEECN